MKIIYIAGIAVLSALAGCEKFVDTPLPSDSIVPESVFTSDASAISALNGAYGAVQNCSGELSRNTDLFGDDLYNPGASGLILEAQENTYTENSGFTFFTNYYKAIFIANSLLEGADRPNGLTEAAKKQIKGESKFLRAFCYFQLMNLYGRPPLVLTTEVAVSAYQGNTPRAEIMASVIGDLKDAYEMVGADYPSADRARANKSVVSALLAKVYLYDRNWEQAAAEATRQIGNTAYTMPGDLGSLFRKSSQETIWQLWTQTGTTSQGLTYFPSNTDNVTYILRPELLNAFEPGDQRKDAWTKAGTGASAGKVYPAKYIRNSSASAAEIEYVIQLRLAGQYLIRAEARAQLEDFDGAMDDVNAVRERTGLGTVSAGNKTEALQKIEQERRIELMTENGSRWFDLIRTGRATEVLAPVKDTWQPRDTILPYSTSIMLANPNLEPQDGY